MINIPFAGERSPSCPTRRRAIPGGWIIVLRDELASPCGWAGHLVLAWSLLAANAVCQDTKLQLLIFSANPCLRTRKLAPPHGTPPPPCPTHRHFWTILRSRVLMKVWKE
jgi:hypothetical protein